MDDIGRVLFSVQLAPATQNTPQGFLQNFWRRGRQALEIAEIQTGAVHASATFQQIVRFVHQHADAPLVGLRQSMEQGADVEVVVVIADDHIGPARHFLAEVIGADLMLQGDLA